MNITLPLLSANFIPPGVCRALQQRRRLPCAHAGLRYRLVQRGDPALVGRGGILSTLAMSAVIWCHRAPPHRPFRGLRPEGHLSTLPHGILSCMSRQRGAALRLAPGRAGGAVARWRRRQGGAPEGATQKYFEFPIRRVSEAPACLYSLPAEQGYFFCPVPMSSRSLLSRLA
jgi:hypothetical protein